MRELPEVTTGFADYRGVNLVHYLPVLGDFNDDGHLDLVGVPGIDAPLSMFLGKGDGTFSTKSVDDPPTGDWSAVAADFNQDGILDLVTSSRAGNVLNVRLGNGDGSFAGKRDYPAGLGPAGITVADLDGDGRPDLVNTNAEVHLVSLRLGQADGTFAARVDYPVGDLPNFVVAVDWDGDGVLDLAVADSTLHLLMGKGDGSFAKEIACGIAIGSSRWPSRQAFVAADFDHDGKIDLASGLGVLLGMDGCNFTRLVDYAYGGSSYVAALATADLNGDGRLDLVGVGRAQGISVSVGDGAGGFASPQIFPSSGNQDAESILVGDLDGDGRLDLVVASSDAWRVLINTCK